jgi:plastocyanin
MRAKTWTGATIIAAAVALVAAAVVTSAGAREEVREIHLVARGMAFYLDADPATANPAIALRQGEHVRFVLRNETPGIEHDLAITALAAAISPVTVGKTGAFDLEVPARPGRYEYVCRPHSVMMKGVIEVVPG